jgi:ribonuclease-3
MEWNAGTDGATDIACNERLEFLGDSVLSLAVTRRLMEWEGDLTEGELSKIRASLVNEEALATMARAIDLGDALLLGRGAHRSGGRELDSLLADAMEAVIGAVFVDAGYEAADQLVGRVFWKSFTGDLRAVVQTDYKTALQELMQDRYRQTPTYEVTTSSGPDHDKQFEVKVLVGASELGRGTGPSKKRASQAAAHQALLSLADSDDANEQEAGT